MEAKISEQLMGDIKFIKAIIDLKYNKPFEKILQKAAEEFQELALAITQRLNKGERVNIKEILEEMVDSQMHLILLEQFFTDADTSKMVEDKMRKFLNSKSYLDYLKKPDNYDTISTSGMEF